MGQTCNCDKHEENEIVLAKNDRETEIVVRTDPAIKYHSQHIDTEEKRIQELDVTRDSTAI